jgi:hypothetical protein
VPVDSDITGVTDKCQSLIHGCTGETRHKLAHSVLISAMLQVAWNQYPPFSPRKHCGSGMVPTAIALHCSSWLDLRGCYLLHCDIVQETLLQRSCPLDLRCAAGFLLLYACISMLLSCNSMSLLGGSSLKHLQVTRCRRKTACHTCNFKLEGSQLEVPHHNSSRPRAKSSVVGVVSKAVGDMCHD